MSGVSNWLPMETTPFPAATIRPRRREELCRLKRELEMTQQERDMVKKAFMVFSRT